MTAATLTDADLRRIYDGKHGAGAYDQAEAVVDWGRNEAATTEGRTIRSVQDYLNQRFEQPTWRVDGLLPSVGAGLILGAEKSGKSLLGLQICLTIAAGLPLLGRTVSQCPTLFVEEEGAEVAHQHRLTRQAANLGVDTDVPCYLSIRQRTRLDLAETRDWLRAEVAARNIGLVVIGPLSQVAAIDDENKAGEVNSLMREINALASDLGILVILTHHRRKEAQGAGVPSIREFFASARGSSALVAAIDVGIGISREQEDGHGWLYVLQREGPGFKEHFDLDPESLCVSSTPVPDRDVKAPPAAVLDLLRTSGPLGAADVAVRLGVAYNTARARLDGLVHDGQAMEVTGTGRKARYQIAPPRLRWEVDQMTEATGGRAERLPITVGPMERAETAPLPVTFTAGGLQDPLAE